MYLVNEHFGSKEYHAWRLAKSGDASVSEKIHFAENIVNYTFLLNRNKLMKAVVEDEQSVYNTLVEKEEKVRKFVETKHGLTEVLEAGEKLTVEREEILSKIARKDKEYEKYSNRRQEVDNAKGEYHKNALDEIKKFFDGVSISELKRIARETPSSLDDNLVDKIAEADSQMKELRTQAETTKEQRDNVSEKIRGLQSVLGNYRSNDYESDRSYFNGSFDLNLLLLGYLAGTHSSDHVWNEISSNQNFKPKPQPVYSTPSYGGHRSGSPSIGRIGGGGFSSRSSFGGGGGFSTRSRF